MNMASLKHALPDACSIKGIEETPKPKRKAAAEAPEEEEEEEVRPGFSGGVG